MKLELPDDHPIAEAIREETQNRFNTRILLRIHAIGPGGSVRQIFTAEIDKWSLTTNTVFDCELTDPQARSNEIAATLKWPEVESGQ